MVQATQSQRTKAGRGSTTGSREPSAATNTKQVRRPLRGRLENVLNMPLDILYIVRDSSCISGPLCSYGFRLDILFLPSAGSAVSGSDHENATKGSHEQVVRLDMAFCNKRGGHATLPDRHALRAAIRLSGFLAYLHGELQQSS